MKRIQIATLVLLSFCSPLAANDFDDGFQAYEKKDYDRAIRIFTNCLSNNPNDARSRAYRGLSYLEKNECEKALADCNECVRIDAKCVAAYYCRATIWAQRKEFNKAIGDFSAVIRLDPKSWKAYYSRAEVYTEKGDYDKAIADYNEGIQIQPVFIAYYFRANVYRNKKNYADAIADWEKSFQLNAKFAPAADALAWHLATCPKQDLRNSKKAIEYATKACDLADWKEPGFLDTLAAAFAEAGSFTQAIESQKKAMGLLEPGNEVGIKICKERMMLFDKKKPAKYEKERGVGTAYYLYPTLAP